MDRSHDIVWLTGQEPEQVEVLFLACLDLPDPCPSGYPDTSGKGQWPAFVQSKPGVPALFAVVPKLLSYSENELNGTTQTVFDTHPPVQVRIPAAVRPGVADIGEVCL